MNKLFFRRVGQCRACAAVLAFLFAIAMQWIMLSSVQPPEGYVFKRSDPLIGIYECCDRQGWRYSNSRVGSDSITCEVPDYFEFLGKIQACGLSAPLNGRKVVVERVLIPSLGSRSPLVSSISTSTANYYFLSDARIRELWIDNSRFSALLLSAVVAFLTYLLRSAVSHQSNTWY
jgi:hypothetical protein